MNKKIYEEYFSKLFYEIQNGFHQSIVAANEEDVRDNDIILREAANTLLPCHVEIIRLIVNQDKYPKAENSIYHIVLYDFNKYGKLSLEYHGEIDIDEFHNHKDKMDKFNFNDDNIANIRNFTLGAVFYFENWFAYYIIPYDILEKPQEYRSNLIKDIFYNSDFRGKIDDIFTDQINYNAKYNLKPKPIISSSELLKIDNRTRGFSRDITIEEYQQNISDIILIPNVPEDVRKVFDRAKKLFIFGYFDYNFFTVSNHYAYLAFESAMRNKHKEHIKKASEKDKETKNFKSIKKILEKLSNENDITFVNHKDDIYTKIKEYMQKFSKPEKKMKPLEQILIDLIRAGVIPKQKKKRFEIMIKLRNSHSHLERDMITMPSGGTLRTVADYINMLYD